MDTGHNSCNDDIKTTLSVIGDKYSALIIRMLEEGDKRFKDFEDNIPEISTRTLTQRLDKLITMNIVTKVQCQESPGRKSYSLTDSGRELHVVIKSMANWGKKHMPPIE